MVVETYKIRVNAECFMMEKNTRKLMGARLGVEPRLLGNESSVLPLDDPAIWVRELDSNQ